MAGVVSPSMWVFELEDPVHGGRAWCSLNEGLGKVLRYGAYGPEVIERLRWMSDVLGPLLAHAVRSVRDASGGVDVKAIVAQMLQMGDEGHNRNRAGTLMLLRELLPAMIDSPYPQADVARAVAFVAGNDHFFLNLGMPACKLATDAARERAGVDRRRGDGPQRHRLRHPGLGHRRPLVHRPREHARGAVPRRATGRTTPTPTSATRRSPRRPGIGGFAMAAAPAIVRFVGGDVPFALATTRRMYEITVAENPAFGIPVLEFRGTPDRASTSRPSSAPASCRRSTPAWPGGWPARARSARGS